MLEGGWVPRTSEEEALQEELFLVTRQAHADGVSRERIAGLLAHMASAAVDPRSEPDHEGRKPASDSLREALALSELPPDCPDCGGPARKARLVMGGTAFVAPCGCQVEARDFSPAERQALEIELPETEDPDNGGEIPGQGPDGSAGDEP